ncbi:hypothetical protein KBC86_04050, partial [Candidatus Gracilibacteria bacterium]|nr:hypothetical protein [Candidatus Gracilibacteria bacterium]
MSEREVGELEVPLGSSDNLGSSTGLIGSTASLAGLVLGNGRDSDFYKIQRENRHQAIKIAIGLEAFTSFFEYIAEHPVSSIPDFAAALNRWRSEYPEFAHRIPKYNKSKWERNLSISTKGDIEFVFGIYFTPRERKIMVRKNGGVVSAEYLERNGLISLNTLEKRLGKTM